MTENQQTEVPNVVPVATEIANTGPASTELVTPEPVVPTVETASPIVTTPEPVNVPKAEGVQPVMTEDQKRMIEIAKKRDAFIKEHEPDLTEMEKLAAGVNRKDDKGFPIKPGLMEVILAKVYRITHPGYALKSMLNGGKMPLAAISNGEAMFYRYGDVVNANKYWKLREKVFPDVSNKNKQEAVAAQPVAA